MLDFKMINFQPESDLASVFMTFSRAIRLMNRPKVPPPAVFNGTNFYTVEEFFLFFERYAISVYGEDKLSWLQVLPSFLEGEPRNIVSSFGLRSSLDYTTVKETVIEVCNFRMLGENNLVDFMKLSRYVGESPVCFSIRLRVASKKIPGFNSSSREQLIVSKFLASLSVKAQDELNVQLGHRGEGSVGLAVIVKLTTILERKCEVVNCNPAPVPISTNFVAGNDYTLPLSIASCNFVSSDPNINSGRPIPNVRCWKCGVFGHLKRQCLKARVKCNKIKVKRCFKCKCRDHVIRECPHSAPKRLNLVQSGVLSSPNHFNVGVATVPHEFREFSKNDTRHSDQELLDSIEFWDMEYQSSKAGSGDILNLPDALVSKDFLGSADSLELGNIPGKADPVLLLSQSFGSEFSGNEFGDPFCTWPSADLFSLDENDSFQQSNSFDPEIGRLPVIGS